MSTMGTGQKTPSVRAVDEEYNKLEKRFFIERQRIVVTDDNQGTEGGFGIVRRAELHQSPYLPAWLAFRRYGPPRVVAIKQIKVSALSNLPRVKRAFTREMFVWSSLEAHPGIAKFVGFYADFKRSEAWLLSPWEPNGNVSEFTKAHKLEIPEKLSLVYDTIDALTFLHQLDPPVCHGDIKSANVLVSADYKARLCDFGLARLYEDSGFGRLETSTGAKGSIRWCSPELIDGAPRAPTSDVYAWAWLVWEIMTGNLPYEGTSADYAIIRKIFESPLPEINGASRLSDCLQVWELLTRCWKRDPQQRPTAKMCKTTVTYIPRCTPAPADVQSLNKSAALLENLGEIESWKGNLEKSSAYFDDALRLYREEDNTRGIASVLRKQGLAAYRVSDYVIMRPIATTALEYCKILNDALGIAEASFYLGFSLCLLDEQDKALPILRESLEIRRRYGDDVGVVQCLERIAVIQRDRNEPQEALSTLDEAVEMASLSGDRIGRATALHVVGVIHTERSDFVKAAEALSEAITITQNIGWEGGLSVVLSSMARLKIASGNDGEAEDHFQESISISRRIKARLNLAITLEDLGGFLRGRSEVNKAAALLEESCRLFQELSQPDHSQRLAVTLVDLKSSQGDWDGALFWHDQIIALYRSGKKDSMVAYHLEQKGRILAKVQRYDEAALHFEAAMQTRREDGKWWDWDWTKLRMQLCTVPKTVMKWERPVMLVRDGKKSQRRFPKLITAVLKPPTPISHAEPYPSDFDQEFQNGLSPPAVLVPATGTA